MRPRIASSEPIYAPKYDRVVPKAIRGSAECATALEPFFGSTPDLYSSGVFKDRTHGVFVDVGAVGALIALAAPRGAEFCELSVAALP
eukprot:gene15038-17771_t